MTCFAETVRRLARPVVLFVVGAAVVSAAYCQAPLYYSNQNQYFLHGLANAGCGFLREDWLANTHDSTPLFSALVECTARYLHPWLFHVYHALLLGVYAVALLGVFAALVGKQAAGRRWPLFLALFVAVHSALLRWCSYRCLGNDYPWFLQAGLAGQYILGPMFQPSMFGVLLVGAISLFVRGQAIPAAVCMALAAIMHSTYLLPAALLMLGMLMALFVERRAVLALGVGALTFVLVLPVVAFVVFTFGPTSPSIFDEAQRILVNVRIPHHTRPDLWLDPIAVLQILWIVLALALARPARLRYLLAVPFLLALLLTLAQVATGSNTLALLFPWRVSSVLVPVATTIILSRFVDALPSSVDGTAVRTVAAVTVALCVAGGLWITVAGLGFHTSDEEELRLMDFARSARAPGQVYFLPVHIPPLAATTRGSLSGDFKPLREKKQDNRLIPVDLQRFRLYTGVPIFVDFKSIPYKDTEVLEWYARLRESEAWQERIQQGDNVSDALAELRRRGITHLVLPAGSSLASEDVEKVHEDKIYQVYRLSVATETK
jgi:hypothetical protein